MNQVIWLRTQLARFTYRPGWALRIDPDVGAITLCRLVVTYRVHDTHNPEHTIPLRVTIPIPLPLDEQDPEAFAHWLQHTLYSIEEHESREWLRRDGAIYDNPHSEDTTTDVPTR